MDQFERQVRERAYYIWEDEGRVFGRAEAHWLRAEAELRAGRVLDPIAIRPAASEASPAPSPAKALKPRTARARTAAPEAIASKTISPRTTAPRTAASKAAVKAKSARAATSAVLH